MDQLAQVHTYYQNTYLFNHPAKILELKQEKLQDPKTKEESEVLRILLSENIFHPQGGGQPDDEGEVTLDENSIPVKALFNDKQHSRVYLEFPFSQDLLIQFQAAQQANQLVEQKINQEKRRLYARIHSGGHFLDIAVKKIGLPWTPSKGFHFPEGSYVEYIGTIEGKAEDIAAKLQQACDEVIQSTPADDGKTVEYLNAEQLAIKMGNLPDYLKEAQNVRYVQLAKFDTGCPCGGTHVDHVKELGRVIIQKVLKKGKNVRVSYKVQ